MDLSAWSKGLAPSASFWLDNCSAQYVSLQADPALLPEPDTSEMKNPRDAERILPPYFQCGVCDSAGSFIDSGYPQVAPSQDCGHHLSYATRNFNVGHCAKRARVENIIKGMTAAPAGHIREAASNQSASVGLDRATKTHVEDRQLRVGTNPTACREAPWTSVSAADLKVNSSVDTQLTDTNLARSKPQQIKLVAEVLKYELSRAVSHSVDSIFRSLPDHDDGHASSVCDDNGASEAQAQALSLVVRKADQRLPGPPAQFSRCDLTLRSGSSQENRNVAAQNIEKNLNLTDDRWNSVRMRSKVNSRLARSLAVVGPPLGSLCLPLVKMESSLNVGDEGLTTSHLKKAKLMFFFTRYPSSHTLRVCFPDVQFTRCITSQLIKWFSNFREFYYIQMEKFARHALVAGVTDVERLTVGRESELFRVLSAHYNKAGDFQIPDRFVEVAEITLREFYIAISLGKDCKPSWKKAIYKVICKLDGNVPAQF